MKIKELYASLFKDTDDSFVAERRRFLKGAAGVAALAVVSANGMLRLLTSEEKTNLQKQVLTGLVQDQTFYLDKTIEFVDLENVRFSRCRFVAIDNFDGEVMISFNGNSKNIVVENCIFDSRGLAKSPLNFDAFHKKFYDETKYIKTAVPGGGSYKLRA